MTEDSILLPDVLSEQCTSAIRRLRNDNDALDKVSDTLSMFTNDLSLQGLAFDKKREDVEKYIPIIGYMKEANALDIADWQKLQGKIGSERYYGKTILDEQQKALDAQKADNALAADYDSKAADPLNLVLVPLYSAYCAGMARHYRRMADLDYQTYLFWKKKEEAFDAIEAATSGMFVAGAYRRAMCVKDPNDPNSVGITLDNNGIFSAEAAATIIAGLATIRSELDVYNRLVARATLVDPVVGLTQDEKDQLIEIYERMYPEYAENMNNGLTRYQSEGLDEHIRNIKVLAYTANEPYKTLFLENIGDVVANDLHYSGTAHFSPSSNATYLNVDKWQPPLTSKTYNVFFHESSHAIDRHLGTADAALTATYTSNGLTLKASIRNDVESRISSEIDTYVATYCSGMTQAEIDSMRAEVIDSIMNQVDYRTYGKPTFSDPVVEACFDDVVNNIDTFLKGKGSISDTYGGFTGNTLAGDYYHGALYKIEKDASGNPNKVYRVYWLEGSVNSDGTNLNIKHDSDGNVIYRDSLPSEFFAESMAANMTRETREMVGYNGYSQETRDFFEEMVNSKL